jgi:hypothetical protein
MTSAAAPVVRDWELERYRVGELSREERERLEALLSADAALRSRLTALDAADAAFIERHPAPAFAAQVRERARSREMPQPTQARFALAFAGAGAAVILATGVFLALRTTPGSEDGDRIKGLTPHVLLFKKTASGAVRLAPASLVRERDIIQLAYQAAGRRYGIIVSVDARGVVTRHLPATGNQAAPLRPGTVALPDAYQLDDAPRWECFYLITADTPFNIEDVVSVVRRVGRSAEPPAQFNLPTRFGQEVFVLRKAAQP